MDSFLCALIRNVWMWHDGWCVTGVWPTVCDRMNWFPSPTGKSGVFFGEVCDHPKRLPDVRLKVTVELTQVLPHFVLECILIINALGSMSTLRFYFSKWKTEVNDGKLPHVKPALVLCTKCVIYFNITQYLSEVWQPFVFNRIRI